MDGPSGNILITGVAGFIGSNLLPRLLGDGYRVTGVDDLSMGSLANVADHRHHPALHFIEADVAHASTFAALQCDFDAIVHLAAFKIPRYGNALETLRINTHGTENVLEHARRCGAKCLVASSSDVYGMNAEVPFSEDSSCSVLGNSKSPRWAYAVSKLHNEQMALAYQDTYGIPVTVLRFFGAYGPHHHLSWWGGPPPVFISAALQGRPMPIHGDGRQRRSFTFIDDTIECLYAALTRSEADGEIINIGSDEEVSILELARLIKELSGTPGELECEFVPYDSFSGKIYQDVMRRVPDTRRCRTVLGVSPAFPLREGLTRTIEWQRAALAVGEPA